LPTFLFNWIGLLTSLTPGVTY